VNKKQFWSVRSPIVFYVFMNTGRPLFRNNPKLRQAFNFALDRTAMLQAFGSSHFGSRTDSYLPSGMPGYVNVHPYPVRHPNLEKARALARGHTKSGKAVLYACDDNTLFKCLSHAQIVADALEKIGLKVEIKPFPVAVYGGKVATRGEPYDLTEDSFTPLWVDPYEYLNRLLDGRTIRATGNANRSYFNSARYNRLMDHAASLSGQARYVAYGKLAVEIAAKAAPMAAYTYRNRRFFVSARVGCVRAGAHGLDLAGLCLS
jgi:peptide/nickel transport system substrate-binding protein